MKPITKDELARLSAFMSLDLIKQNYDTTNLLLQEETYLPIAVLADPPVYIPSFIYGCVSLSQLRSGISGVYSITNETQDPVYVGQSGCLKQRFTGHAEYQDGYAFHILETAYCDEIEVRLDIESTFIRKYLKLGHPLKNNCHVVRNFWKSRVTS